ncbi:antigen-presenting glycoprotein CD1d-like isoform X1 [Anas platyrhynchos]|uniref:antigen-presenting glycoprotein CD1d-like isoform X1 n=1 Tax=Anas platyrhynchos TaxID=8839 RepID=UPI000F7C3250|nr:antigen-presenting glycoprotein CD1d-like [Anas platyrhynchos]|eukprot:XP_027329026.1 antigen-presenting glycoprotein CD1d-like isoform X1 [Anas platyrhynchos]
MTVVCQENPKTAVQTPLAADASSTAATAQAEQQQKEVCSCGSCSPFRLVLHPLLNAWGFTTGSMQFPCLLLFILPGMWADPEGSQKLHLFQTFIFYNSNFVDLSAWATLEDIIIAALQNYTREIIYLQPWVSPALPADEWENLQNLFRIYVYNYIQILQDKARLYQIPYPFVLQCKTGCELYPNGSSTKFYHLAYNAHSFLSFDVDSSHWKRWQENELAVHIEQEFNSFTDFSATLQLLLNSTCIDHMKRFIEYGRAALERREPPVATVFAHMRDPAQLLLVCHVTGFYPRPISVAWLRDGQEVSPGPGLNTSTILPNADLTYQLRSTLIVAPDDGHTYACRVRHCSLGTRSLLIPWGSSKVALGIGVAVVVLLTVAAACIATVWYYRHRC